MPERKKSGRGHGTFEHTSDLGLRAWGRDLTELFDEAGAGLIELMLDPATVRPKETRQVSAEAEEPEELLIGWLEEVLFALDGEGFAPASVRVERMGERRVVGALVGELFSPRRHTIRTRVKAVTYHDVNIHRAQGRLEVRVILDV
ncbi:MAG: archease [Planctomycetes bacterium]|nr:archease [Planctomycetota bacterium]